MKRFLILASMAIVAMGAVACTREKPAVTEPTPTQIVGLALATPTIVPGVATPTLVNSATEAPTLVFPETPALPTVTSGTSVPTVSIPTTAPTTSAPPAIAATPTSQPPPPVTGTGGAQTYTVQWGDWLNRIAARFGVTTQQILAANPGLKANQIYPGQVINIPAGGAPIPTTVPGASPTVPPSNPPPGNLPSTYTVQRGEWFYAIARKFNITVGALQAANPGVNPNFIYPGQVLRIPGGSGPGGDTPPPSGNSYVVKPGDTLFTIALKFGKTVYGLQIANRLSNPNFIYPGQTLVIP